MRDRVFIDSFSGALADLKKGQRTEGNALAAMHKHPRVSTWDMSEYAWVRNLIGDLKRKGLIEERGDEPYPWHRYALTNTGRATLTPNA